MTTAAPPVPAGTPTGGDRRAPGLVAALAVTQTIGYGTLYYAYAVLLTPIAADLHTSTSAVTGAFAASVLTGAVLAVPAGRHLDRHGGRALMTAGSLAGAGLLVAWAHVHSLAALYAVQIGIGAASAASLYEAAFAVVIAWHTAARRPAALLALTVVAGFASTIFLPLTGWLVDRHGWRSALVVLAMLQAVTAPLHAVFVRPPPQRRAGPGRPVGGAPTPVARATRSDVEAVRRAVVDRGFWLLAVGFAAHTAAISALGVHLIPALVSFGHSATTAAAIAGLLGVLSVAGRLLTTSLHRRWGVTTVTAAVFAVQAAAALALPALATTTAGAVVAVAGFGIGFGVATVARPSLLADRYDTRRYATLAGILVIPITLAKATAPLAAAVLYTAAGGHAQVTTATAVTCAIAAAAIWLAGVTHRPTRTAAHERRRRQP